MAKEIEFKFSCNNHITKRSIMNGTMIHQGYLHVDKDQQIRVRLIEDNKAFICIKHMIGDGNERDEYEYEIPFVDGHALFDKCKYKLFKIRTKDHTLEGFPIDIDWYPDLALVTAEVELPSRDTTFTKPNYFEDDISGIHEYSNYHIAGIPKEAYQ